MTRIQFENKKKHYLKKIKYGVDMPTKLMWQNVYFWLIRNEDKVINLDDLSIKQER